MDLSAHLATITASVLASLKLLEGKLCAKGVLVLIRNTLTEAVVLVKDLNAAPDDKRTFLEQSAAIAFDAIWNAVPLPMFVAWMKSSYITNKYIRPNALWAIDLFVDDAYAELAPIAENALVKETVTVVENVVASTTTTTVNTPTPIQGS